MRLKLEILSFDASKSSSMVRALIRQALECGRDGDGLPVFSRTLVSLTHASSSHLLC